jgi:PAS domain S-box-containing protein
MGATGSRGRERRSDRNTIDQVTREVAAAIGMEFFSSVVKHLAHALSADGVYAGEFTEQTQRLKTLAAWMDGSDNASFDYPLSGSIAAEVANGNPCSYRRDASELFPEDPLLRQMQSEACVGVALSTSEGRPIGTMMAMYRKPLVDAEFTKSLLEAIAPRAAAELIRKRTEDALRESDQRYRAFIAHSPYAMWRVEFERPIPIDLPEEDQIDGLYLYGYVAECNDAAALLAGWQEGDEFVGTRFGDIAPRHDPRLQDQIRAAVRAKYRYSAVEVTLEDADGNREYRLRTQWGIIEDGMLQRIWFTSRDLTELKQAQLALRASERRFITFLDSMRLFAVILNRDETINFCNDHLLQWAGWSEDDLIGRNWFEMLTPAEERDRQRRAFASALEAGEPDGHYEGMLIRRNGERRLVSWDTSVLRDHTGRVSGIASIGRDVTRTKVLEQQLAQAQRLESLGRLAGGVASNLNQLLTILLAGAAGLLDTLKEDQPAYPYLCDIVDAGRTAGLLTHRLLAFSRGEKLELEPLNLNAFLVEAENTIRALLSEDIDFRVSLDPSLGDTCLDSGWITQLLMQLVFNARDAMPDGGVLTVTTANVEVDETQAFRPAGVPPGHYVRMAVSDTGTGMAADAQAHSFEPGFSTKEPGKGYGLSTVFGIVRQSGGYVWTDTSPHGTTVNLLFPRTEIGTSTRPGFSRENAAREGEVILVLDDHDELRTVTAGVLRRLGYRVLESSSGADAVAVARRHEGHIHLLITQLTVRDMARTDLVGQLRISRADMKILCTSPFAIVPYVPGESHIQMPFTTEALAHKVRAVLDSAQRSAAAVPDPR